jgi:hypothetical protein
MGQHQLISVYVVAAVVVLEVFPNSKVRFLHL